MDPRPHIRVEMLSNPLYLCGARDLVSSVARRFGFDDLTCSKIALAVDEALANVIRHGYDRADDKPIWLSIWPLAGEAIAEHPAGADDTDGMKIVIEDEARQVDPSSMKGRDLDHVRPGGLGTHIIREVMDEVVYEQREATGMRLILVKRVGEAGPQEA